MAKSRSSRGRRKPLNVRSPGTGPGWKADMTQQMPEQQINEAPQPDQQFVIMALQEELNQAQANRLYMLSMMKQKDAQLAQMGAQLSQLAGELERLRAEQAVMAEAEAAAAAAQAEGGN